MAADPVGETTVSITAFKARCLVLIDGVAKGKFGRIVITRRGVPVAAILPVRNAPPELWGAMHGSVRVMPGTDLTQGIRDAWEAKA
jgi:prevent-host-death family protein